MMTEAADDKIICDNVITMPGELRKDDSETENSAEDSISCSEDITISEDVLEGENSTEEKQTDTTNEEQYGGSNHVITFSIPENVSPAVVPVLFTPNNEDEAHVDVTNEGGTFTDSNLNSGRLTNHQHVLANNIQVQHIQGQIEAAHVHQNFNNQIHGVNPTFVQNPHLHQNHNNNHVQSYGNQVPHNVNQVQAQHAYSQPLPTGTQHQVIRQRSRIEDEYSYLPATHIFLQDGTLNPRYNHLFHSGYFMFRKQQAPWLANSLHIFGIAVDASSHYIVYIPVLDCEQSVPGSALSLNPSEPNPRYPKTFLACISGVSYIATRLRVAPERSYNQEQHKEKLKEQQELMIKKHQQTGSSVRYVDFQPGTPETFSIFGVPVFKSQSYYVYIPEFKNEYTVPGLDLSPNPDDKTGLLVTIHRRRYHATSLRPVFPELVFHKRLNEGEDTATKQHDKLEMTGEQPEEGLLREQTEEEAVLVGGTTENTSTQNELTETVSTVKQPEKTVSTGSEFNKDTVPESQPQQQLVAFGIPVQPKETYYVHVPDMRQEYIIFGEHISQNDSNTVKITVEGTELVGTEIRPAFITNNFNPGDRDVIGPVLNTEDYEAESSSTPDKESRYKLVAFGVPIHPDQMYEVYVPILDRTVEVQGNRVAVNPDNKDTIVVEMDGVWQEGTSVKEADTQDSPSDSGESYPLQGLITAFGVPVLPGEKYRVFVPSLQTECVVYGRHIHSHQSNNLKVLVIVSGLQFEGTSVRLARSPNCPKYKVGTVVSSSERRNIAFISKDVSGSDTTLSGDEKEKELEFDLKIRPSDFNQDLPQYVINSVAIFPEKFYCVFIVKEEKEETIMVKGCEFEPLIKDQQFFNIRVGEKLMFIEPYFRIIPVQSGPEGPKTLSRNKDSAFGEFKLEKSPEILNEL